MWFSSNIVPLLGNRWMDKDWVSGDQNLLGPSAVNVTFNCSSHFDCVFCDLFLHTHQNNNAMIDIIIERIVVNYLHV
uniref:Uncharacterized protein n=1 Tax=Arion vulgaris TaxID=1028688 RepID=A0A0B6Y394_9EUPU